MMKVTPAHLEIARQVLVYLKGVKGNMRQWCASLEDVCPPHTAGEVYANADASSANEASGRKSTLAYYLFVNNNVFFWR